MRITSVTLCGIRHAIIAVENELGESPMPWRLTRIEAQLAADLLDGASNAELARRRGRSINTVRNQLVALYRKLGVGSRREAIAVLLERSL